MSSFKAVSLDREAGPSIVDLDDAHLPEGNVVIDIDYSDLNYKDGLVIAPGSRVARTFPLVPGIDFAGRVVTSATADFAPGDLVTVNGHGIGTDRDGGLAQRTCVPHEWLIRVPSPLDAWTAAALGTAGYTSALAVLALQRHGITPEGGPVLVTGAAGGAGSVAIMLLHSLGYDVVASTGREAERDYLLALGASDVIGRISEPVKSPMASERWKAAIDTVGSHTLVNALASTRYDGAVATMGMAQGVDLSGSVLPFILRGVSLLGIDSVNAQMTRRVQAWDLLAAQLTRGSLEAVTTTIGLDQAAQTSQQVLAGSVRGRVVVDVNG